MLVKGENVFEQDLMEPNNVTYSVTFGTFDLFDAARLQHLFFYVLFVPVQSLSQISKFMSKLF